MEKKFNLIGENELFDFEECVLHCIENNPKNDNFKFRPRGIDDDDDLQILNGVRENKEFFESELAKVIGKCEVIIDFNGCEITVKKR